MPDHDAHDIIVLFSGRSRDAYAAEATARGETYTFTDAWGLPRTWVKGEYAYLAPNAAGLLLARCNLKHHLVEEAALDAARLARCRALLDCQRRPPRARDHRAHRRLAGRRRPPPDRQRQDQPAAAPARPALLRARAGAGLYRLALAGRLAVRRRRLGAALRQRLQGPSGTPHRAGQGQPRARRPGRAFRRSQRRHDGCGGRAGAGHRAHRQDGLRRQPGASS